VGRRLLTSRIKSLKSEVQGSNWGVKGDEPNTRSKIQRPRLGDSEIRRPGSGRWMGGAQASDQVRRPLGRDPIHTNVPGGAAPG